MSSVIDPKKITKFHSYNPASIQSGSMSLVARRVYDSLPVRRRSWAMRPARVVVVFILSVMSWLHLLLGRPLVLYPCTCPSNISFSSPSCLFTWPKYFSFLLMMVKRSHPSLILSSCNMELFVLFSVHGSLRIVL